MPKDAEDPPVLTQDGRHEEIMCHYDEEALTDLVGFSRIIIAFDYEGYFIPNSVNSTDYVTAVDTVQHSIFVSLGVEAGLLKKSPKSSPSLQASGESCVDLLGDFNVTEKFPHLRSKSSKNRKMKANLKGENDIFMLGLSSLPLDELESSNNECVGAESSRDEKYVPANAVCRSIHAGITAYIATTGNGTIVDPSILEVSTSRYIQKEMTKRKFVTKSMPYTVFIGIRSASIVEGQEIVISQSNNNINSNQPQEVQGKKDNVTAMGTSFIAVLCIGLISSLFVFARRMKKKKKKLMDIDEVSSSNDYHSPICSLASQHDEKVRKVPDSIKYQEKTGNKEKKNGTSLPQKTDEMIKSTNRSLLSDNPSNDKDDVVSCSSEQIEVTASESMCCFVY